MLNTTSRKVSNKAKPKGPKEWVSIRITGDIVPRLHALQADFAAKHEGATITLSALIARGLAMVEAAEAAKTT